MTAILVDYSETVIEIRDLLAASINEPEASRRTWCQARAACDLAAL